MPKYYVYDHMNPGLDGDTVTADSAEGAIDEYLSFGGDYDTSSAPVLCLYIAINHDDSDDAAEWYVTHHQDAPPCEADEHEWHTPHEVVGGLKENPGVFGHDGDVKITEVCRHCGAYRVTDTWYQDPNTGIVWPEDVITYRAPDDVSLAWVESQAVSECNEDACFTRLADTAVYDIVDGYTGEYIARGVQGADAMQQSWPRGSEAWPCDETSFDGQPEDIAE